MARKQDEILEREGGVATMAPEGSADRVRHDDDELLHPPKDSTTLLAHAFCAGGKGDTCADCGWAESDHNPDFGKDPPEPGVVVTDYNAAGEAIDHAAKPSAQGELPGVPRASIWGEYQGHRLSHVQLAFGGGPDAPKDLAGRLRIGDRVHLIVSGFVAKNGYATDKDGIYFGQARLKIDAVTVPGAGLVADPEIPPELIRRERLEEFVVRAATLTSEAVHLVGDAEALESEQSEGLREALAELVNDLAHALDPLPFEGDDSEDHEAEGSALDQSLAEAMAEA